MIEKMQGVLLYVYQMRVGLRTSGRRILRAGNGLGSGQREHRMRFLSKKTKKSPGETKTGGDEKRGAFLMQKCRMQKCGVAPRRLLI